MKIITAVLVIVTLVAIGVSVWALFFRSDDNGNALLAPDYAPVSIEKYAEDIGDDSASKLEQTEGGGAVSMSYSTEVGISLSEKTVSLFFENPGKSNQDVVIQIVIHDTVVAQSGRITPGKRVTMLDLPNNMSSSLEEGGYNGKIVVLYYQPENGEKAILNTDIPVNINVSY
ncbi:MAG: hypothetical protein K6F76_00480 [Clostridiales bacterium]|nr:hypothetical protein [Clostridiales bacterium]